MEFLGFLEFLVVQLDFFDLLRGLPEEEIGTDGGAENSYY
jgi:hypothetical protein